MFENGELAEGHQELVLNARERKAAAVVAWLDTAIMWMYSTFAGRLGATGMTSRSVLHGSVMLTLPFLVLFLAALRKRDFATGLLAAAIVPLALLLFPFCAFASWFTTARPGPLLLLCPVSLGCMVPAIASLRRTASKAKFVLWTLGLAFLLGNYYWFGTLVYLGQKALWAPCPPNISCH